MFIYHEEILDVRKKPSDLKGLSIKVTTQRLITFVWRQGTMKKLRADENEI